MTRIYKLVSRGEWEAARAAGAFRGAAVDLADGYIHFSTGVQAVETARKYFAGLADILIVGFEAEALGPGLKWEPSRGGDLFPHLYGPLDPALAVEERAAPLGGDGHIQLGALS
ncbi:MAG: dihydroorotate dehydrogenase [Caulobacter sp.]|nr:dihydroorotate dehydrogenase [Caulobacter sp.]